MAKVGLNNFRYSKLLSETSEGVPSYDGPKKPAKAISCSVNITNNQAKLFADDGLAESDTSFQSGTVTAGIDDEDQATSAELLGHEIDEETGAMIRSSYDAAPYVSWGRIVVKMVGGVYKYKVEFLYKVKFAEPSQDDSTKGESLEFSTSTIEGQVSTLNNGRWSETKTFDTHAEALAYLEGLTPDSTATVTEPETPSGTETVADPETPSGNG